MLAMIVPQYMSDWNISLCECDKQAIRLSWLAWPRRLKIASEKPINLFDREQNNNTCETPTKYDWASRSAWHLGCNFVSKWCTLFESTKLYSFLVSGERFARKFQLYYHKTVNYGSYMPRLVEILQARMDRSIKVLCAECRHNVAAIGWPSNQASSVQSFTYLILWDESMSWIYCERNKYPTVLPSKHPTECPW